MKKFSDQLKNVAQDVTLPAGKKAIMRAELRAFIHLHGAHVSGLKPGRLNNYWGIFSPFINNYKPMIAGLLIAALLSGSVSYAAENSLPGDALYPIKVSVNEPVRAAISVSADAKAEWEARRAERRLEEAATLVQAGRTDAQVSAQIEANFSAQAERVKDRIASFESRGDLAKAANLAARFETSLNAHEEILARVEADARTGPMIAVKEARATAALSVVADTGTTSIITRVGVTKRAVQAERLKVEARIATSTGAEVEAAASGRMNAAENKITEVKRYIERAKTSLGASSVVEAEAHLKLAEVAFAEGKTKLGAKAYRDAFTLFGKAHRLAQEAKLSVTSRVDLKVNVPGILRVDGDVRATTTIKSPSTTNSDTGTRARVKVEVGI